MKRLVVVALVSAFVLTLLVTAYTTDWMKLK